MSTDLRNLFGTVVHDVPEGTSPFELRQLFGTVVHDVPEGTSPVELRQLFGTVVHDVPEGTSPVYLRQFFGTVTTQISPFSVFSADITGTIATSSMFSASVSGEWSSGPKTYPEIGFEWEFVSVPSGSQIAKIPPLPDNSSPSGWVDMSDNVTLFHFNEDLSWSDPTTLNAITGSSSFSNALVSNGSPASGSNPAIIENSLGDIRGIKLNQGVKLQTTLSASQLHITGAEARTIMLWANIEQTSDNDDKFLFSYGDNSDKGQLGLKKVAMGGFPPGTPDQGNLQRFESYTGFDGYSQPSFYVPNVDQWRHWAVTYESGSNELIWYVDGEMVFVDPLLAGNHSDPTNRTILATTDTDIIIGGDSDNIISLANTISASFSEFAIFSSSLPQSQIREIYNKQKSTGFYQDTWTELPDNAEMTQWVDMADNVLLYHFDEADTGVNTGSYQLPDNKASGSILNMSGNTGLWHLSEINIIPSSSTQIGSVGLVDSWGDGWHGANWISVLVNSIVVINSATLASGGGPEWYDYEAVDGDTVEVIFSTNGCPGPSYGSECSFILNSGSAGSGTNFSSSAACPIGTHSFTANGFLSGTIPAVTQSLDSSGNGFHGTPSGATLHTGFSLFSGSTEFTGAMDFDSATSQDIDFPGTNATALGINGNNSRTTMLWAKADAWAYNMNLFAMGTNSNKQDWSLLTRTDGFKLNTWGGGNDLEWDDMTSAEKDDWFHVACVWDGSLMRLYLNGTQRATNSPGTLNTSDTYPLRIGNSHGYNGDPWNGLIQEFAMFNEALPASEILKVYNNQKVNSITSRTINDSSGQGNDGSSVLDYATASVGPFSGSTAWSGSGTNQISIGDLSITGSTGLSFSTWLKPTKNLTDEKFYVFDFTNGSNQDISLRKAIGSYGGGQYQNVVFEIGAGSVQSRGMFDQNTGSVGGIPLESGWIHWVATADGAGSMSLYKNGELINSASGQGAIPDAIRTTNYIGIKSDLDASERFEGELSEFAMWQRELSEYEIQKIYQHQYSGSSIYNNYGVEPYSNSASFLPDVSGDYIVQTTAYGSTAFDFATASISDPTPTDCAGVIGGTAYTNSCGICVGGTTGLPSDYGQYVCWDGSTICTASAGGVPTGSCPPLPPDCAGTPGGTAYTNSCGFCVGGTTGLPDDYGQYVCWDGSIICSASSGGVLTGSCPAVPTGSCIERPSRETENFFGSGFVINNYKNLSKGRDRRVDQVPFKLGIKDKLGLRLDNTIATPFGSTPTYCSGS